MSAKVLLIGSFILLYLIAIALFERKRGMIKKEVPLLLGRNWMRGSVLLRQLRDRGMKVSGINFYIHMDDLTQEKIVEFQDLEEVIDRNDFTEVAPAPNSRTMKPLGNGRVQIKVRWFRLPS